MDEKLKEIIIDKSSLEWIVRSNGLYIDKTKYILSLIRRGTYFFLSRPRRFGKSLLIDTLENIFKGNRELFKGTYIYDSYDFEEHPVIRFSMNDLRASSNKVNTRLLLDFVMKWASYFHVEDMIDTSIEEPFYYFSNLLRAVYRKTGKKVVVLIDEYDYPLMQSVKEKEKFEEMRDMLQAFYETLKVEENSLRFCFLTGITRFQHVSIFSKLNNLTDISSDPKFSAICGYTDDEIDHYFAPYMEKYFSDNNISDNEEKKAFRVRMKEFYDGYRFSLRNDVTMYNPVSVGKFFLGGCSFENFWIETGAQSLVDEIVSRNPELFHEDVTFSIYNQALTSFNMAEAFSPNPDPEAVYSYLVQAGYLTIRGSEYGKMILGYPNREVSDTMNGKVLRTYGLKIGGERLPYLYKAFSEGDTEGIIKMFREAYVNIPYDMFLNKENNFQVSFYSALMFLGFDKVEAEEKTNIGRMDVCVVVRKGVIYIIELKLDESADEALNQIKEKKYFEKYAKEGTVIHLLGINFSSEERNITGWKEEIIRV